MGRCSLGWHTVTALVPAEILSLPTSLGRLATNGAYLIVEEFRP